MFNSNFLGHYIEKAPLPLALERLQECQLLSEKKFIPPLLDIGCGDGIFAEVLFKGKVNVGIDPHSTELKRAKLTGKYEELIECYGHKIPKPDKSFNTIFSNSVMEHIPEIGAVLKEAHRLLSDEGTLYLTLPTHLFEQYTWGYQILSTLGLKQFAIKYRKFFNQFWQHYHCYSPDYWRNLFEDLGFKIEHVQEYGTKKNCLFNNLIMFGSLPSFFARKFVLRWFWFPQWRKKYSVLLQFFLGPWFNHTLANPNEGGLIAFSLSKKHTQSS